MGIDTVYEQDMQTAHIIQPAEEMAAIIQQFDNIVIVAHGSPDGDAIGATGAMGSLVKAFGKRFVLYNATGIPDYLEWVPLPGKLVTKPSAIPFKPGLIIVLDCGDAWRMGKELLAVFPEYPSVNIDHHLGNPMFASLGNWVDPGMAATGQMVAAVADAAGVPLTGELAQCVYLSLVSDTGSFTHGNTSAAVFTLAARLVANGLDAAAMREKLDNQWSMPKTKLWGKLMQTLSLECDGTVAVCPVTMEEIGSFGAVREDLEGFAEQMRRIKGVRVAVRGCPLRRRRASQRRGSHHRRCRHGRRDQTDHKSHSRHHVWSGERRETLRREEATFLKQTSLPRHANAGPPLP